MKNIFKTLFVTVLCSMTFGSCSDVLDIKYDNTLSASTMWKDASDLEKSVPAIYQRLRNYFSDSECNVFYFGEIRVGDYMWGPSLESNVQDNFKIACRKSTLTSSNTISWSGLYTVIDQTNAVLYHADECGADEATTNWAKAQAYFGRAFSYFYAARVWGDVPINLVPVESTSQPECYPERSDKALVYAQVEADIAACEACGNVLGSDKYLGTANALNMLKAEYALWMYRTQNGGASYLTMAEDALDAIGISSSTILPKYADIFDRTNKKNAEVVFALNNTASSTGGYQVFFCQPSNLIASKYRNNPVPISSTQWWSYSEQFVSVLKASETAGDTRVATNLGYGPYSAASDKHEITWCNKFLGDMSKAPVVQDNDLLYYRSGLAVMMLAELKYYQEKYSDALDALNIIAKRAYGNANHYTDTRANSVKNALVKEYFLEFPAEGVIWWALLRLGEDVLFQYNPDLEAISTTNKNYMLWPVAHSSMTKNNKIKQTEGWS